MYLAIVFACYLLDASKEGPVGAIGLTLQVNTAEGGRPRAHLYARTSLGRRCRLAKSIGLHASHQINAGADRYMSVGATSDNRGHTRPAELAPKRPIEPEVGQKTRKTAK